MLLQRNTPREMRGRVFSAFYVMRDIIFLFGMAGAGLWNESDREANMLDGGAHFYNVYETADGEYVSIASYEPKFYANLLTLLGNALWCVVLAGAGWALGSSYEEAMEFESYLQEAQAASPAARTMTVRSFGTALAMLPG